MDFPCLKFDCYMSDEQEENSAEEEEEENEGEEQEENDEDEQQEDEQGEEDEADDQEEGSNDDEQQEEEDEGGSNEQSKQEKEQPAEKLPKFRSIQTEEFKFSSLLSEISSLSTSVDHFINTLTSHGGSSSYYRSSYVPPPLRPPQIPLLLTREEPRVVVMKDEDTQVSMQPQIVIQQTRVQKPVEPAYKISSQSSKFLAQLYEQNKKLKRWQNSSHSVNNHSSASGFHGSRQRFERQEYEKGLFNVDERNKQIDHAIEMLKREANS